MSSIEVDMYKCFFLEICWSEGHSSFGTQWVRTSGRSQGDLGQSYVMELFL